MNVNMIWSEERGTWNVFVNGEWYYEGNYEEACNVADSFYFDNNDEYYGDNGDENYYPEEEYDYED